MHYRAIGWPYLECLHPFVFRKTSWNDHILIVKDSSGGDRERLGKLKYNIWRGDAPTLHKILRGRRHVLWGAFSRSSIDPRHQSSNFIRRQRSFVREMSVTRIGKPGRHDLSCHHHPHRGGPRQRIFVGEHREGSCFARPMAGLAMLLQNRRDVLGKCRGRTSRFLRACSTTSHAGTPWKSSDRYPRATSERPGRAEELRRAWEWRNVRSSVQLLPFLFTRPVVMYRSMGRSLKR